VRAFGAWCGRDGSGLGWDDSGVLIVLDASFDEDIHTHTGMDWRTQSFIDNQIRKLNGQVKI
jgi:hypothetical protein